MVDLFIEHGLFSFDPQLLLLPPLLKLHLVVVHHIVCLVQVGLDGHTLPHNVLNSVIARQTSSSCHVTMEVRHSTFDIAKSLVKHLQKYKRDITYLINRYLV